MHLSFLHVYSCLDRSIAFSLLYNIPVLGCIMVSLFPGEDHLDFLWFLTNLLKLKINLLCSSFLTADTFVFKDFATKFCFGLLCILTQETGEPGSTKNPGEAVPISVWFCQLCVPMGFLQLHSGPGRLGSCLAGVIWQKLLVRK